MSIIHHNCAENMTQSPEELKKQADDLLEKLNQMHPPEQEKDQETQNVSQMQETSRAFAAISQIFSGIIVGGLIGYGLDMFLETTPWLTVIFFPIGFIAGIMNMIRMLKDSN